jgi:hypothetical protein
VVPVQLRQAISRERATIVAASLELPEGEERDRRIAEAKTNIVALEAQMPTPEDEAKANLKAKAEQAQRQGQIHQAEQDILTKAAANSPDHITLENVLTEAPDEVLKVIE